MNLRSTYLELPEYFYQRNLPQKFPEAELQLYNDQLLNSINIDSELFKKELLQLVRTQKSELFNETFSQAYMGHQFGHLNLLGDGRAHLIGEVMNRQNQLFDLQLKGSGQTRYSRRGDGLASLGPMLREYLISEAMASLEVPTTRSLAVLKTGQSVFREKVQPGGILVRLARSHVRVGTFQFAWQHGGKNSVQLLADHMIQRMNLSASDGPQKYKIFFETVVLLQAQLVAKWLSFGFVHGVMNTDNMSIMGETIDYGPCAFIDVYDPLAVFSSIDQHGRYAYMRQVEIAQWNLARLAETMLELFSELIDESKEFANQELHHFIQLFQSEWFQLMSKKIGFVSSLQDSGADKIWQLIIDLLELMNEDKLDFTNTFLFLSGEFQENEVFKKNEKIDLWQKKWLQFADSVGLGLSQLQMVMKKVNPLIIPRNYLVEEVIEKAIQGDFLPFTEFLSELQSPFQQSVIKKKMQFLPNTTNTNYQTFCGT